MDIIMTPYPGLPCELKEFTINGLTAFTEDFGYSFDDCDDTDTSIYPSDIVEYGCINKVWKHDKSKMIVACKKYNITESEFMEICKKLEKQLSIGECGWCV